MDGQKKYGLQLRGPSASISLKKPLPVVKKPSIFQDDDLDDDDDVERAINRQAAKNRALKEVEQQHKAALEEDPSIFDYDGVYEEMKGSRCCSNKNMSEQKKQPKYIMALVEKAKARQQEQEIVYERKLLKERQQEDHLYGDKEKFVTVAYKKKLAERDKWLEEDRRRQLQEAAEEVTKKEDIGDFYRNLLSKNVAFGAGINKYNRDASIAPVSAQQDSKDGSILHPDERMLEIPQNVNISQKEVSQSCEVDANVPGIQQDTCADVADSGQDVEGIMSQPSINRTVEETASMGTETISSKDINRKPTEDALAAAKERYLARKRLRT